MSPGRAAARVVSAAAVIAAAVLSIPDARAGVAEDCILFCPFDGTILPETVPAAPTASTALVPPVGIDGEAAPRFVAGFSDRALLVEESRLNLLSPGTASADEPALFRPENGARISRSTGPAPWEGPSCLRVEPPGAVRGEGFATAEIPAETLILRDRTVHPSTFVASLHLRGSGRVRIFLRDTANGIVGEPVFADLTDRWVRHDCALQFFLPARTIGPGHDRDWREMLPPDAGPIPVKLQMVCAAAGEPRSAAWEADGLQIENRPLPFSPVYGTSVAPLSWTPGGRAAPPADWVVALNGPAFDEWRENGTISFRFRPTWSVDDGAGEPVMTVGGGRLNLGHAYGSITTSPAGVRVTAGKVKQPWRDAWHHVALTWTADGGRVLYLDGTAFTNDRNEKSPLGDARFVRIHATANGAVDDFALFRRPLSAAEVAEIAGNRGLRQLLK